MSNVGILCDHRGWLWIQARWARGAGKGQLNLLIREWRLEAIM